MYDKIERKYMETEFKEVTMNGKTYKHIVIQHPDLELMAKNKAFLEEKYKYMRAFDDSQLSKLERVNINDSLPEIPSEVRQAMWEEAKQTVPIARN